jgi:hypothetical protein
MEEVKYNKRSESAKKRWANPEQRQAKSEQMKATWAKRKAAKQESQTEEAVK